MDVYEKLETSKLDDDVKISVVLREAPTELRDNLPVNSPQFESTYNKLRLIIQAYLNSNNSWIANDFRNDTKELDPMEADRKGKSNGKGKGKSPLLHLLPRYFCHGSLVTHGVARSALSFRTRSTCCLGCRASSLCLSFCHCLCCCLCPCFSDAGIEFVFATENVVKDVA